MQLGQIGVWRLVAHGPQLVGELEGLGYGTYWVGGNPSVAAARPFLEASTSITVATGILNVWEHEPSRVAADTAAVERDHPGRFLLGLGIGHSERIVQYDKPFSAMREYLDALDRPPDAVPRSARIIAALGPKMLGLAAARTIGAHPYFSPPAHTTFAREVVGPDAEVATEVAVVVEPDLDRGRRVARDYASHYLARRNYRSNLLRFGFDDRDLADGGSDRLIDTIVPHGPVEQVADAVRAHLDAGANHVCIQALEHGIPVLDDYRGLATELL